MTERGRVQVSIASGDDFPSEMKRRLNDALRESVSDLEFLVKQEAKAKIREEGAIWLGRLMAGFDHRYEKRGDKLVLVIYNEEEHAPYVEWGAEYGATGPPVAPLIPWVQYHLSSWELDVDEANYPSAEDVPEADRMVSTPDGGEVDALAGVPDEILTKAFWLQEKLKEDGLEAVEFMQEAEEWAEGNAAELVSEKIDRELSKL